MHLEMPMKLRVNKLKQLFGFVFKRTEKLLEHRQKILTAQHETPSEFLQFAKPLLMESWK